MIVFLSLILNKMTKTIEMPKNEVTFKSKISIDFPLRGEWRFLRPPGHHPFAFDFVQTNNKRNKYFQKSKIWNIISYIPAEKYYCWEQPVYSPIDGKIIQVGIGWKDHTKTNIWRTIKIWYNATYKFRPKEVDGKLDIRPNAGNYVMIKAKEGYIVFLAHLRNGSTKVKKGDLVKKGELIGNVGNSGNSTAPHLHINLFDQMDNPFKAKVLPFVFNKYEELGSDKVYYSHTLAIPKVKSFIKLE